ncbi:glycosyltransferase family 2 protein [Bacillus sp. ISL-47]|uniref:glycosyltransferase family 2 protein n=1 Tax=Bacillus sp. ISL-47 TaxID=2819130 RepID=UPI001BE578DA|nr:glycosyltransferase family 2 protein [Bacillus sp. ISL-47]MBT2689225.1 glycosyltransferase family 2 protein [Bacillus sp. ISL-47]MBT2708654.1 glycosyltransferase family 2 protein [Pseudomonas sp. ISL-84]
MQLVSIIVPIYNSEVYLDKTITSILSQTYKNLEILLINDGSIDNSLDIITRYKNKDSRIKVFSHQNSGQSFTRNKGIENCTGDFLVFLDSDDWIEEHFIEKMYTKISEGKSDIVVCDYYISYPNETKKMSYNLSGYFKGDESFRLMLNSEISHTCWGKMYKTSLIKKSKVFFPVGKTNEDLFTVSIWFLLAKKVTFLNEALITSRDREGSITNSFSQKFIDLLFILKLLKDYLIEKKLYQKFENDYKKKYQKMILYLANYGVRMKRIDFIKEVIRMSNVPIGQFNKELLTTKEKVAVSLLSKGVIVYYLFTRIYYKLYAKHVFIVK